jgi:CheY-like chemotaxis protein
MTENFVVLLVDDREDDIFLVQRAFRKANITNPLIPVTDGEQAIDYLKGEGKFSNRNEYPLPSLILLDLKMPKVDGFEVLTWIRQQPKLKGLAVVVLTSSTQLTDVNRAYELGANSFLVKPLDFENYQELGRILRQYWMLTVRLPESERPCQPKKAVE